MTDSERERWKKELADQAANFREALQRTAQERDAAREQLSAETKRREEAERDRDTWRVACAQMEARAEQADRGWDEARNGWLRDAELLKRAEADNAREREAHGLTARGWETEAAAWKAERDALLERMRALEKVQTAATYLCHEVEKDGDVLGGIEQAEDACAAADALKVPRE